MSSPANTEPYRLEMEASQREYLGMQAAEMGWQLPCLPLLSSIQAIVSQCRSTISQVNKAAEHAPDILPFAGC